MLAICRADSEILRFHMQERAWIRSLLLSAARRDHVPGKTPTYWLRIDAHLPGMVDN
jgi:hypothetical protein